MHPTVVKVGLQIMAPALEFSLQLFLQLGDALDNVRDRRVHGVLANRPRTAGARLQ